MSPATASAAAGYYGFPSMPIGEYEVTVDHAGFAQATGRVLIETARETRQDFTIRTPHEFLLRA